MNITLPSYKEGIYGKWTLKHSSGMDFGYWSTFGSEGPSLYWLSKDGIPWMSSSRMERESHQSHLEHANGSIVVAGVGMGMFLNSVALSDSVTSINAIEIDQEIIDLLKSATDFDSWKNKNKITLVNQDALNIPNGQFNDIDFLYVDIWPILGDPQAVNDTQKIQQRVNAKKVGYWGQELDFLTYLLDNRESFGVPNTKLFKVVSSDDWLRWAKSINLPIPSPSTEWLREYLPWIALNMVMRMQRDERAKQ